MRDNPKERDKTPATALLNGRCIEKAVNIDHVIALAEKVFAAHARGDVRMPPKIYIHLPEYNGDFRAMPAYVKDVDACGIKWVNVHPENKARGLPAVMAMIILSDPETGYPLAVMDGTRITNLRTGAAGAVAAKYLADPGSSNIGFVGCGTQARFQLIALKRLFKIKNIAVYDPDRSRADSFIGFARTPGLNVSLSGSVRECVQDKDIVITTTPSRKPIVKSRWISPGTHINAIGADAKGKVELESDILKRAMIVVDDATQAVHSGEINVPIPKGLLGIKDIHATLGEIITGKKRGRESRSEITLFDSTGLAIQDIAVASYIYKRSRLSRSLRKIRFL